MFSIILKLYFVKSGFFQILPIFFNKMNLKPTLPRGFLKEEVRTDVEFLKMYNSVRTTWTTQINKILVGLFSVDVTFSYFI